MSGCRVWMCVLNTAVAHMSNGKAVVKFTGDAGEVAARDESLTR